MLTLGYEYGCQYLVPNPTVTSPNPNPTRTRTRTLTPSLTRCQYLVPWQFPINYLLYIPSILSDIALVFYTSREVKQD